MYTLIDNVLGGKRFEATIIFDNPFDAKRAIGPLNRAGFDIFVPSWVDYISDADIVHADAVLADLHDKLDPIQAAAPGRGRGPVRSPGEERQFRRRGELHG
jgi:hypothetical protein